MAFNFLATIFSPYLKDYNLLVGIGRGEGLLLTSIYIVMYLIILQKMIIVISKFSTLEILRLLKEIVLLLI